MRCFVHVAAILVALAAALCISHVDGSKDSEVTSVEKRQVPLPPERVSNQEEPCNSTELQRRNELLQCRNGLVGQQLLDVLAGCGYNDEAMRIEGECGLNEMGRFCIELIGNSTLNNLASGAAWCARRASSFWLFTCSNRLRELRDGAGCCAHHLINLFTRGGGPLRNPNVWSTFNVTRPNNCPNILRYVQSQSEIVCSQQERTYRLNRLSCNPDYITPFINFLRDCGLEEAAQARINRCGVNRYERFCFEVEANASQLAGEVWNRCSFSSGTCPVFCQSALNRYRTGVDCCFNNLYNNTLTSTSLSDFRTTNRQLWSLCGVSSPGFCPNTVDNSTDVTTINNSSVNNSDNSVLLPILSCCTSLWLPPCLVPSSQCYFDLTLYIASS